MICGPGLLRGGVAALATFAAVISAGAGIAEHVEQTTVAGIDVHAYRTGIEDVVVMRGWLPAGDCFNPPSNPAIASLVSGMLDKGTARQDKFAVAKQLEDVAAAISFGSDSQLATFSVRCLKQDLPLVISLLAEQLREPAFSPSEFSKLKQQATGGLQRRLEDTGARAGEAFRRAIFPKSHPNHPASTEELITGVAAATLEDVKAFHHEHYGPAHLSIVAVGDVDMAVLRRLLGQAFEGWSGGSALPTVPAAQAAVPVESARTVAIPGKTSVNIAWGQVTGLRESDPGALPLQIGTAIFGSGFTGRLMGIVRDKEGLSYGVYAGMGQDTLTDGDWVASGTFAPALLERGIASMRRELMRWWKDGVTASELADRKINFIGSRQVGMATTSGIADQLVEVLQSGRGIAWLDHYPEAVDAVTLDQVNSSIRKYLDPEKMVLVEAGTIPSAR